MTKAKPKVGFVERMKKLAQAGLTPSSAPSRSAQDVEGMETIEERVRYLLHLINHPQRPSTHMLFFVMYDIESNKVRTQVSKYLLAAGCTRVQKSIFLADLPLGEFEQIKSDLAEVQACYENEDSILVVPISTDFLQAMKVIGKTLDVDLIMKAKNTLFF